MSRSPKFSVLLPWVEPSSSSKTNGDRRTKGQHQARVVFRDGRCLICSGESAWSCEKCVRFKLRTGFRSICELDTIAPRGAARASRVLRSVPAEQQGETFHLLSYARRDNCSARTARRADFPVIGVDKLIQYLETASLPCLGVQGHKSHVD